MASARQTRLKQALKTARDGEPNGAAEGQNDMERARNNFLNSRTVLRRDRVVPFWEDRVKRNFEVGFQMLCRLAAGFVSPADDIDGDSQSGTRLGAFDQLLHQRHVFEDYAFAGPSDMREEQMFDRVVFGTVRRVVCHAQGEAGAVGQALQVLLEQRGTRRIAASAIT